MDHVFYTEAIPVENAIVETIVPNQALSQSLTFPLDTQLHFQVIHQDQIIGNLTLTNRMAIDASLYFDSGKAKLFYSRDQDVFICHRLEGQDPALEMLLLALPKLPLIHQARQLWWDYLPISAVTTGLRRMMYQFGSSFFPQIASARYIGQWQSESTLVGSITIPGVTQKISTSVTFDHAHQLLQIKVGDRILIRQP
jgi:hypothetical protein